MSTTTSQQSFLSKLKDFSLTHLASLAALTGFGSLGLYEIEKLPTVLLGSSTNFLSFMAFLAIVAAGLSYYATSFALGPQGVSYQSQVATPTPSTPLGQAPALSNAEVAAVGQAVEAYLAAAKQPKTS